MIKILKYETKKIFITRGYEVSLKEEKQVILKTMKRYEQYKNSGVNWIGEIPSHWEVRKLKHSVDLINDKTSETGLRYVALEHIESFSGKLLPLSNVEPESICNKFQPNDILFCKLRPYLAKCILIDFSGKCTSELLVLRNFKGEGKFLHYLLLSPKIVMHINASTYGSKMPRANWIFIGSCYIPLPAKEEQHAIVTYLDTKVNKIDSYIATAEKKIAALDELKKVTIANAVTHGIHPNVPMKDSGIRWIGQVPEHWGKLRAKNMFERQFREVYKDDEVITCFRDGQVTLRKNRRIDGFTESLKEIGYQGIRRGDLVIHQMDAFAGAIGVSDSNGKGTPVYICSLPKGNYNVYYYAYLLREMARTGFIKSLYRGIRERSSDFRFETFAVQWLPVLPLSEQEEIVSYISHKVAQIDKMRNAELAQIEKLKEYKQRLISDVVTGKVKV